MASNVISGIETDSDNQPDLNDSKTSKLQQRRSTYLKKKQRLIIV